MDKKAQDQAARRRKRRRVLFFVKLFVIVLMFANMGLLGWYFWKHPIEVHVGGTRRHLAAKPGELDFGRAEPGKPVERKVTVRNRTRDEVEIQLIDLTNATFRLEGKQRNLVLPPRSKVQFTVIFDPELGGVNEGEMRVRLRGESSPDLIVPLRGETLLPRLAVSAESLNFGEVKTRAGGRLRLRLRNSGTMPLTVNDVTVRGDGFSLARAFAPVTVEPAETLTVEVTFVPTRMGASKGTLVIESNDPNDDEMTVALAASYGTAAKIQRERAAALALLREAKRDLGIAYAYLSFESTDKLLTRDRHRMGQDRFDKAWPKYERANEALREISPALVDKEFYLDETGALQRRAPGGR